MFGLGGDNEDNQKFWNMILFKVYMSDKEIKDSSPLFVVILILLIIAAIILLSVF
jgi:hypothetical protein